MLAESRPRPAARYVWSHGADHGEFGGAFVEGYAKDLELARAEDDVLIAYEMNGRALPPEHGFPARLVVPGYYGTNSVKWLTRITLAEGRALGPFTKRWYNDPVLDASGDETGETTPVWSVAPDSVIVSPSPQETVDRSHEREIWGWAGGTGQWAASPFASATTPRGDRPSSRLRGAASGSASPWPGLRGTAGRR